MIKNLVFEGCGVLGISFVGAIRYMEENNLLNNIEKIIGSSAGAMIATTIAIGINSYELEKIFKNTNFNKLLDKNNGIIRNLYRIIFNGGLYKGEKLEEWIGSILKKYTGNENITFLDIYKIYKKELIITGTNLDQIRTIYFNHIDYPNMPVKKALRISGSIPYMFKYVKYNGDTYIDGGVIDNYPIWYFNDIENTIGLKLISDDNKKDNIIYYQNENVSNVIKLSFNIIKAYNAQLERLHVHGKYWIKTIAISNNNISGINFNINDEQKNILFKSGYKHSKDFFEPNN